MALHVMTHSEFVNLVDSFPQRKLIVVRHVEDPVVISFAGINQTIKNILTLT